MKHRLEIDSVLLEFGNRRILQDVYVKSETGKVTGVLGRNGTGKTSLFRILFGELRAGSQSVRMNGTVWRGARRLPADIRYLPQHNFIPESLKVKRVMQDFEVDFERLIANFPEFVAHQNTRMIEFSSGQRRLIETFAILTSRTKFCMLDEPFSQVMPLHVHTIQEIIQQEKENKGIIVTDHMYRDIITVCDELYVISEGRTHLTNGIQDLQRLGYLNG